MCRRIVQHYMHHDVRTPIVLHVDGGASAPLYAHPLRTTAHICDIKIGLSMACMGLSMDANKDMEPGNPHACEYHSCCICRIIVDLCPLSLPSSSFSSSTNAEQRTMMMPPWVQEESDDDLPEPEECPEFRLEHRHIRHNYRRRMWHQQQPEPTWRDLRECDPIRDWRPAFRRDPDMFTEWTTWMLDHMAKLYAFREEDARALAALRGHIGGLGGGLAGFALVDRNATTAADVRALEEFIQNEFRWAVTPPR